MPTPPNARSVKIADDERGGWSSDRPRRAGAPREADVAVRCKVLRPEAHMRYSPGSLLMIVSASPAERDRLAERVLESPGLVLSLDKVRALLTGRGAAEEVAAEKAPELLDTAVAKRLEANETVVLAAAGVSPEERERYVRLAARFRRPRHLILVEAPRDQVADEDRAPLNELRRRLDAGELGAEGFHSALRLGGQSVGELRRVVFRPEPRDD
ncbi:MAG: ATP-binding protein [Actinomycetota bacterium]|nr:ATP-binding protein [Actinomycetota bacterium]